MTGVIPNFFIPGAPKAGTSSLSYYLSQHPDIYMGLGKEPGYFSHRWEMGLDWYRSRYAGYKGQKAIGDATPSYLSHPESARRIKEAAPDARFIVALRNPVERAVSHYWHRVKRGHERRPLAEVLRRGRAEYPVYDGLYHTHISRYLELFPRENFQFCILERMRGDTAGTVGEIFSFLGVDRSAPLGDAEPQNRAQIQRSRGLGVAAERVYRSGALRLLLPEQLRRWGGQLYRRVKSANLRRFTPPELTADLRRTLDEYFQPEIEALEKSLRLNLEAWKTSSGESGGVGGWEDDEEEVRSAV